MHKSARLGTDVLTKRLTFLYMAALSSIALLTIGGQAVVQNAIVQLQGDSRIVNIAGRQRMLSQRLTRLAFQYEVSNQHPPADASQPNDLLARIQSDLETWTQIHEGLQQGSETLQLPGNNSPSVQLLFNEMNPHFEALRATLESKIQNGVSVKPAESNDAILSKLGFHSDAFLKGMDQIVSLLENEARERVHRLQWIETALLAATIAVLIFEGFFVFSPAVASLRRTLTQLQSTSDALERAKDVAEKANLAKTEFLAKVSHELRTPIHAILGMLCLVQQTKLKPQQSNQVRLAYEASTSLLSLVNDLLDVDSIEQGKRCALHPQVVDLEQLIRSTCDVMRPLAHEKGLRFELQIEETLPNAVRIDADRLRQVLFNLFQNAIRYTHQGSVRCVVSTDVQATKTLLCFAIEDTGIGISQEDQHRIFESFTRTRPPSEATTLGRSMGLGLQITHAIVDSLDGTISLRSELGRGSRFAVTLPIESADPIEDQKGPMEQVPHTAPSTPLGTGSEGASDDKPTALIVDDSSTNLLVMRSYLRLLGYRSMSVSSLKRSVAKFRRHRFDIVLMDKNLNDGDGLDFPKLVANDQDAAKNSSTQIFLVTAEIQSTENRDPRLNDFVRVLHKPISLSELRNALPTHAPANPTNNFKNFDQLKQKLADAFLETLPSDVCSLRKMLLQRDYAGLEFLSHRMIGSAGNAGLTDLATLSRRLHNAASQRDMLEIEHILSQLPK